MYILLLDFCWIRKCWAQLDIFLLSCLHPIHPQLSPPASHHCLCLFGTIFGPCFLCPPLCTWMDPEEALSILLVLTVCARGIPCAVNADEFQVPARPELFPEFLTPSTGWLSCFACSSDSSNSALLLDSQPERDDGHPLHPPLQTACNQFPKMLFTSEHPLTEP